MRTIPSSSLPDDPAPSSEPLPPNVIPLLSGEISCGCTTPFAHPVANSQSTKTATRSGVRRLRSSRPANYPDKLVWWVFLSPRANAGNPVRICTRNMSKAADHIISAAAILQPTFCCQPFALDLPASSTSLPLGPAHLQTSAWCSGRSDYSHRRAPRLAAYPRRLEIEPSTTLSTCWPLCGSGGGRQADRRPGHGTWLREAATLSQPRRGLPASGPYH
ncbi:hypothetical protein GGTG_07497 [Gaeumannomyces tritici R3-111a-1]|uniref:Uncharacterized protein n=1 Tax=Gaeumannomyces tritici (strain R3-111a-1) TaxID=644352 RepID=J3P1U9_GAET3|nr:hypothetical protein GGTG_07497 [Gaeumannomyces tritici R3-111a-1]EJT73641.1 hypothetical protein GGTG_07497 [Gaeumannomyces tritici R3-111a-1]